MPQTPRRLGAGKLLQLQVQVCKLSKPHAFLRGVFDGTLSKRTFAAYLCQNISYLDTYASCLDLLAARLSQIQGFEQEARELKQWARETRDM